MKVEIRVNAGFYDIVRIDDNGETLIARCVTEEIANKVYELFKPLSNYEKEMMH